MAADHPIWIAIRGGTPLPLEGNLANANNLVTARRIADPLRHPARRPSTLISNSPRDVHRPPPPLQFEQRLRALISLTTAANARQPEIAALLRSVQLRRDDRTVRAAALRQPRLQSSFLWNRSALSPRIATPYTARHTICGHNTDTPDPFRKIPRTISMK